MNVAIDTPQISSSVNNRANEKVSGMVVGGTIETITRLRMNDQCSNQNDQ
jgi:hypothetical protein